jgi:outer membrane protein, heavy metal efflux system
MKRITSTILFLTLSFIGFGQSFDSFMKAIEQNNPQILALEKWLEAEETKAKTGLYPNNPEVRYHYLLGSPKTIGNQQEFEISQSFKLPGYYTSRSAVQSLDFEQKLAIAEKERREILHVARTSLFNLISMHKMEALLQIRSADAEKLVAIMQQGFEAGEVSKPSFDRARIYAGVVRTEWQKVESEIQIHDSYLIQLNGGNPIEGFVLEYPVDWELPVMDTLLARLPQNDPDFALAQLGVQKAEKELKMSRMNNLPDFDLGYRYETILQQNQQGIFVGLSIPLWQNLNELKYAKLHIDWSKADLLHQESEARMMVSGLFYEAYAHKASYEQMKIIINEEQVSAGNMELLLKGQISFFEYLTDANLIWDGQRQFILHEKAYFELLSKLKTFE